MNTLPLETPAEPAKLSPQAGSGLVSRYYYQLIDRLARVTTSGRRIPELDGLRFIAIFSVVIQHMFQFLRARHPLTDSRALHFASNLARDSRFSVELFFVISGFILASPFAAQHIMGRAPVKLRSYYWRRVTRLEPPYLLSLAICFATLVLYWHLSASALVPHLLASGLYLHNVIYNHQSTINQVTWSLEIEVQFYLLAPLLAFLFCIRQKWLRRAVFLGGSVVWLQLLKMFFHSHRIPETLLSYLPFFLMGFVLADIYLVDWKQSPPGSLWCDILAAIGWLALPLYFVQERYFHRNLLGGTSLPFILLGLCWLSFRGLRIRKILGSSFIMTVGGMCYSIYLLHFPLLRVMSDYSPIPLFSTPGVIALYSAVWILLILAVSTVFFIVIEKPCMQKNWPQNLWATLRRAFPGSDPLAGVEEEA